MHGILPSYIKLLANPAIASPTHGPTFRLKRLLAGHLDNCSPVTAVPDCGPHHRYASRRIAISLVSLHLAKPAI
jgi:hypothetical protein